MDTVPQDDTPCKQCTRCKQFFPHTKDYFYSHKGTKDDLTTFCKPCVNAANKEYKLNPRYPKSPAPEGYRRCSKCKQAKPATLEYFRAKKKEDPNRLSSVCRKCAIAYDYARNKTHYPTNVPKGYKRCTKCGEDLPASPEYFSPQMEGKYGLTACCRRCRKLDYAAHKEDRRLYAQKRSQDPFYKERRRTTSLNYLARKRAVPGEHTAQQIREQYARQHGRCYYCRKKIKWGEHEVEHTYPLSRVEGTDIPANDIAYLVIACSPCNVSKGNKYPWEWSEGGRLL